MGKKGKLFLIPVGLAPGAPEAFLPAGTIEVVRSLEVFVVEDLRTARRFLKSAGHKKNLNEIKFLLLNEHTPQEEIIALLKIVHSGQSMGLLSEAGLPCVADPGSNLVAMAHEQHLSVVPLVGPSSIMLALMASGMNGQQFVFHGYLPVQKSERAKKLREIEIASLRTGFSQIFIETPYRNMQMLITITEVCRESTLLCIARDLGSDHEIILTQTISEWKKSKPDIHKRPAVFLINH
ncbi:MAG: SAM-dependent methyltransferase [Bacteroidales bacterium]|nr:SAM-dependent methyltransferase [Bacteroidales bacterium]MDZ4205148.1 SAM-dependent methyltransferase [Bacteroidales bacterium]